MKKITLVAITCMVCAMLWAAEGSSTGRQLAKPVANPAGMNKPISSSYPVAHAPKSQRAGSLQKVLVGKANNMFTILESTCNQIHADSVLNTVLFIHRSDTVTGNASANVAQYRYDISKDGGATWNVNKGPLNPLADNININGRYPEAMIHRSPGVTTADSAYLIYRGVWHNGANPIAIWEGSTSGRAQLSGDPATFTSDTVYINNGHYEISTSLTKGAYGHYFALNRDYSNPSSTTDTIRGLILERGIWDDNTHSMTWTWQRMPINTGSTYTTTGSIAGNALFSQNIAFDPTGRYGWIMFMGDLTEDQNFTIRPVVMSSTDYGATWSSPVELNLDNMPGMFPTSTATANLGKTIPGRAELTVDSAGNPHIAALVAQGDTTGNTYGFFPFQEMALYDINYTPGGGGCNWNATYLSRVFGYSADYTVASGTVATPSNEDNRIQIARSDDGKKIFIFWDDTDSSIVAPLTDQNNSSPNPNLFGIGIDMGTRKVTNKKNFTAGDPMFGGAVPSLSLVNGTLGGALFPVVSQNVLPLAGGVYNIPVVLTEPDYLNATNKLNTNPARFYYCQNINFSQSDFVNKFDNIPPTLTVIPDTPVVIQKGHKFTPPTATAVDCIFGTIQPVYSSTLHTDASGNTDSCGYYTYTYTATNSAGNTATFTQQITVADKPIARIYYVKLTGIKFAFTDTSLNLPTTRSWVWGDGSSNNLNQRYPTKQYSQPGTKCVILTASNKYGSSKDTVCVLVSAAGINDPAVEKTIAVYPNPSTGSITVELEHAYSESIKMTVYNILGEAVSEVITVKPNTTNAILDLNNLESGLYLLKVETPNGTAVKELTINK